AVFVCGVRAGMGGCFDERPAQVARSALAERSAQVALAGLVDARAEAAVAGELAWCGEAVDVAELGGDRVGDYPTDPRQGQKQRHIAMSRTEPAQLTFALVDLALELVDQAQAGLDRSLPGLRQSELGEQLASAHAEEVGDGAGLAVREQHRVHA